MSSLRDSGEQSTTIARCSSPTPSAMASVSPEERPKGSTAPRAETRESSGPRGRDIDARARVEEVFAVARTRARRDAAWCSHDVASKRR